MSGVKVSSICLLTVFFLFANHSFAKRKTYDRYRVIRVETSRQKDDQINGILRRYLLDVWRRPSTTMSSYDVMISPRDREEVTRDLDRIGVKYITTILNVQQLIDDERATKAGRSRRHSRKFALDRYHTMKEIRRWMKHFALANRDIVKLLQVGISYQGHRILAMKIGVPSENATKRIIWQDAGIHAREWVTGATLIWFSRKLVNGYREGNPKVTQLLERLDWYILPVWNVDGYKYTWSRDRMWRKSRSQAGSYGCHGVDLNRNFPTPNRGEGTANDNACSEVYHGAYALSEIESKSVAEYMLAKKPQLAAVLTLHSYGQYLIYPYGYTYQTSRDHEELENLSINVVKAMQQKRGTVYKHGTVSSMAYQVSGGSIDWSYRDLCVKYTFGLELRDTGMHGFILPPSLIIPTAEEYYEGVEVIARHIMEETEEGLRTSLCSENNRGT